MAGQAIRGLGVVRHEGCDTTFTENVFRSQEDVKKEGWLLGDKLTVTPSIWEMVLPRHLPAIHRVSACAHY